MVKSVLDVLVALYLVVKFCSLLLNQVILTVQIFEYQVSRYYFVLVRQDIKVTRAVKISWMRIAASDLC